MSKFVDLASKLDQIPHLDLDRQFDVERLQAELDGLDPALFVPFRSISKRHADMTARSWQGVSLIAPNGLSDSDLTEEYWSGSPINDWTAVAEQTPYMKEIITSLGGEGQRARIMRMQPQGRLAWHRHNSEPSTLGEALVWRRSSDPGGLPSNWSQAVVHIPIRINPQFVYAVIDVVDYQTMDIGGEKLPVHEMNYPAGEAWVFNSTHVHNAFNRSQTEPRYSLMLTLDLRMKKSYGVIAPAVERYLANQEGPLMGKTFDVEVR